MGNYKGGAGTKWFNQRYPIGRRMRYPGITGWPWGCLMEGLEPSAPWTAAPGLPVIFWTRGPGLDTAFVVS